MGLLDCEKSKSRKTDPSDPSTIKKFVDPLPIPETLKPDNYCHDKRPAKPFYSIEMCENNHRFHRDFPLTRIWGYNGTCPGPTIEVNKDTTIRIKWINNLPDKHLLPVDHTLHGCMDTPDVRTVVHLHGANVAAESDGNPEAWFAKNYSPVGPKFTRRVYEYTNHQPGGTIWYHDHAVGITRLNIYSGLAGFYLIRDRLEKRLNLPKGEYEIPIMIQDKTFNKDGSLFYPDNATPPVSKPIPSTPSFFFGNTIAVNGKLWPYLNVEPRKYRFRILNASNVSAYSISLDNNGIFTQIGTELGLLHNPVEISSFTLEPAERIDLVIDFSKYRGKEIILTNSQVGPPPGNDTAFIMKFRVILPLRYPDTSTVPEDLLPYHPVDISLAAKERTMQLDESTDRFGRVIHLLNNRMWHEPVTEIAKLDTIEIWHFVNHFNFPHSMHVHLVHFEIIGRKPFTDADFDKDGNYIFIPGNLTPPLDYERGLKDTVSATPGEVTTVAMHFKDHIGDYVWHCHVLEHEDNDMMRPLWVIK